MLHPKCLSKNQFTLYKVLSSYSHRGKNALFPRKVCVKLKKGVSKRQQRVINNNKYHVSSYQLNIC